MQIALDVFLSTPTTNCSPEKPFSVLKRVKNHLRSTMSFDRLNSLAILDIESSQINKLYFSETIKILLNNSREEINGNYLRIYKYYLLLLFQVM